MRIAVIGSGIAGLSAAWLLSRSDNNAHSNGRNHVTIFEKSARLGMDAFGIDFDINKKAEAKQTVRIDMPLRVFTESYYPNLTSLYEQVGVKFKPEDYAASFTSANGRHYFGYRNLLLGKLSIPYLLPFASGLCSASFWKITRDIIRFQFLSPRHLRNGRLQPWAPQNGLASLPTCTCSSSSSSSSSSSCALDDNKLSSNGDGTRVGQLTLAQYLNEEQYSSDFIYKVLLPALAGICTCSYSAIMAYPAFIIVHYVVTRSMRGVRRAQGGAQEVVDQLSRHCTDIKLNVAVESIRTKITEHGTRVVIVRHSNGVEQEFDHVIISTQANQALSFLPEAHPDLRRALNGIQYEKSNLVLHTDVRLMPRTRADWKSVNFILEDNHINDNTRTVPSSPSPSSPTAAAGNGNGRTVRSCGGREGMASIWMNRVQPSLGQNTHVFQTWNPIIAPTPDTILCQSEFERPIVSYESLDCLATLWRFQGHNGISFCGSYAICGMPLLETAVSSAVQVSTSLGSVCPWLHRLPTTPSSSATGVSRFSPLSLPPAPRPAISSFTVLIIIFISIIIMMRLF